MASNANIKAVITAEDRASGTLKGFSNNVESMGHKVATTAKAAAVALGVAGAAALSFSVKSAANFEQTRIGLENMLGSADKARKLLKDISKFAAETPFEFPELAQSARQLVAFGFSAEEAFKTMKQLGNVSAAVGAPINDLAYLMGTLRTQGRAFTIDIRQFAQRGIPIYEELGKVLKVNGAQLTAMIEDGKVGFKEVQQAFDNLAGAGGKWGNTMEKQSKSINGLFSTLKDTIGQTARELVGITQEGDIKEGSVFARLRDAVNALNQNLPQLINNMKELVRDIIPQLQQWAANITHVAQQVSEYLSPKLQELWSVIERDLIPVLSRWWHEVLEPLVPVIGTVLVIAIGLFIDALSYLVKTISVVIDTGTKLFTFFTKTLPEGVSIAVNWTRIKVEEFKAIWADLPGWMRGLLGGLAHIITDPFTGAYNNIRNIVEKIKSAVQEIQNAISKIKNIDISPNLNTGGLVDLLKKAGLSLAPFASGGFTGRGGENEVAGIVHKGEYVIPQSDVDQRTGLPKASPQISNSQTINITVQAGAFMGSQQDARKYATMIMDAYNDAMAAKGMAI